MPCHIKINKAELGLYYVIILCYYLLQILYLYMLHECCHFLVVGCLILKVVIDELLMHWNLHHSHLPLQQTVLQPDVLSWMDWPSQDFGYLKVASRAFWQQCPVKQKKHQWIVLKHNVSRKTCFDYKYSSKWSLSPTHDSIQLTYLLS